MKVAMVKHSPHGKVYWFEVPEESGYVYPGAHVACDTARGMVRGIVVGSVMDECDVYDIMIASGAKFPLRKIVANWRCVPLASITIPKYFKNTKPRDETIAKRFLELYNTGGFQTDVIVSDDGVLQDGYSAYLVAKFIGVSHIDAITNYAPEDSVCQTS